MGEKATLGRLTFNPSECWGFWHSGSPREIKTLLRSFGVLVFPSLRALKSGCRGLSFVRESFSECCFPLVLYIAPKRRYVERRQEVELRSNSQLRRKPSKSLQPLKACAYVSVCCRFLFWDPQIGDHGSKRALKADAQLSGTSRFSHDSREFVFLRLTNSKASHR